MYFYIILKSTSTVEADTGIFNNIRNKNLNK